jgi:hypothetical protein
MRAEITALFLGTSIMLGSALWIEAIAQPTDALGVPQSPKQSNDPVPPAAMPPSAPPGATPTPRGTPEGMGNEVDLSKTPGDDDPSDGVDEPGRNPVPGIPREAPGVNKP